jgi:hypothetical protein
MKQYKQGIFMMFSMITIPFLSFGQQKNTADDELLNAYYGIKNALVGSDVPGASTGAKNFLLALKKFDAKTIPSKDQPAFSKMKADAETIAAGRELEGQRAAFQSLSENMITRIKATGSSNTAFIAYCPMKKASWISAEAGIKNPYYGSTMLTCGKVTDTIK